MKKLTKLLCLIGTIAVLGLASCEKAALTSDTMSAIADLNALAVGADSTSDDAIYIINTCKRGDHRDPVAFSALPASIGSYLTANYPGYTFKKAFQVSNSSDANDGYIVVVQFENKPVGLKFDNTGNFVKVFEQRERRDLRGKGWRHGGHFDCRDGLQRDTLSLSALPSGIKSYFSANYPADTLLHALTNKDGSYLVLSANNGLFVNIFKSDNTFIKRVQLPAPGGKRAQITESSLPAATKNYLSATYPSYVFKKAFAVKINSAVQGYVVLIDANATKYALRFDANGNFVKTLAVR
jgi:hypothetical protein